MISQFFFIRPENIAIGIGRVEMTERTAKHRRRVVEIVANRFHIVVRGYAMIARERVCIAREPRDAGRATRMCKSQNVHNFFLFAPRILP